MTDAHEKTLLIAEQDSDWSGWVPELRRLGPLSIVLQRPDEPAAAFAARVREALGRMGGSIASAALIGASRHDPEALSSRASMVQAISSRMGTGDGRLYLVGDPDDARGRLAMQALADALQGQVKSGVRVETDPPETTRRAA